MKLLFALTAAALLTGPALSAPCRDTKGHFTKCPAKASVSSDVQKGKDGKCRWTKTTKEHKAGMFTKCT